MLAMGVVNGGESSSTECDQRGFSYGTDGSKFPIWSGWTDNTNVRAEIYRQPQAGKQSEGLSEVAQNKQNPTSLQMKTTIVVYWTK